MSNTIFHRLLSSTALVGVILSFAVSTASAAATPLAPGGKTTTFSPMTTFAGTLLGTYTMSFANADENGRVTEDAYLYNGTVDFYYQVANNASSSDSLSRVTVGNFKGFTTSVDFLSNGDDAPSNATRQSSGTSIGFNFDDGIDPGTSSDFLEVVTNARIDNSNGTIAVLDSIGANFYDTLGPGTVPEPSSWALLAGGLGILTLVVKSRSLAMRRRL